jgi:hypothetical protein
LKDKLGNFNAADEPFDQTASIPIEVERRKASSRADLLEQIPERIRFRAEHISVERSPDRLGDSERRKQGGFWVVNFFCRVQEPRSQGTAKRHADRQQRETGEADEAKRCEAILQAFHEFTRILA